MSDVVEDLRLLQEGAQWACGATAATLGEAADEIVQLRGTLRRALRLYEIEQAEHPPGNEPIWVKLARQLLERER